MSLIHRISGLFVAGFWMANLAVAGTDVSITVDRAGIYGRIDLSDAPRPEVIYKETVIIERGPVIEEPIYLYVPPGHAKNWRKHCHRYQACSRPVYFVQEDWYENTYVHTHKWHDDEHSAHKYKKHKEYGHPEHGHKKYKDYD